MQRTVVIYLVAAATLVGAFLLVPKTKTVEPPPPPPPVVQPDASVTHLSYANGELQVDARLSRGLVANLGSEPLWLDLTLQAAEKAVRPPLTTVLVIDRSGSMAGDKIEQARLAAHRMLKRLDADDEVAIISYGTDVTVDLALGRVADVKSAATRVIDQLEEGGGTNIDGGLRAAQRVLQMSKLKDGVARVLLVSDGRATEGERRPDVLARHAESLAESGVNVSTLGVGLDYNEDLMERLAVEGRGRYHYLKHARDLGRLLDDELAHATRVVARNVAIQFPMSFAGLSVADVPGGKVRMANRMATIPVGDLAAGETRRVLVRIATTLADPGDLVFAAPEISYARPADGTAQVLAHRSDVFRLLRSSDAVAIEKSRRDDVRARVLQVQNSLELTQSMQDYRSGQIDQALKRLRARQAKLKNAAERTNSKALKKEAQALDGIMRRMSAPPTSSAGMDLVKEQKARAFDLRR